MSCEPPVGNDMRICFGKSLVLTGAPLRRRPSEKRREGGAPWSTESGLRQRQENGPPDTHSRICRASRRGDGLRSLQRKRLISHQGRELGGAQTLRANRRSAGKCTLTPHAQQRRRVRAVWSAARARPRKSTIHDTTPQLFPFPLELPQSCTVLRAAHFLPRAYGSHRGRSLKLQRV
ncbi:hypothetical protein GN956_G11138 [Arapaima gigas]